MGDDAWPFLANGMISLLNSENERGVSLLNSLARLSGGTKASNNSQNKGKKAGLCLD